MPEILDRFKALANQGVRRLRLSYGHKPEQKTPEEVRDDLIDGWLETMNQDGLAAFIEQLDEWTLQAKDGQRLSLVSHPTLCLHLGHEDAYQQVRNRLLRKQRGQSDEDPQSR